MLFLVTFEYVEPGPTYPPDKVTDMVENAIVPSLEMVAQLEKAGKIKAAGVIAGTKGSVMILDVADNNELSQTVQSFPFWSLMKVRITPLQKFTERAAQEKRAVKYLRDLEKKGALNLW
jgi:muconolactone delta-isomerase